jgi:hypothetical protein
MYIFLPGTSPNQRNFLVSVMHIAEGSPVSWKVILVGEFKDEIWVLYWRVYYTVLIIICTPLKILLATILYTNYRLIILFYQNYNSLNQIRSI